MENTPLTPRPTSATSHQSKQPLYQSRLRTLHFPLDVTLDYNISVKILFSSLSRNFPSPNLEPGLSQHYYPAMFMVNRCTLVALKLLPFH
jgi:hypothetical protein